MNKNLLNSLPDPPNNKTGWPWTDGSATLPYQMPDGSDWPKISIVTPSYNQAQYLEETIRSVLLQNYPNLEYIIMDGGSTDGSVEIIKKYEPWLAYWESKKDRGQSHAINKGFTQSTGNIIAWINSDDYYAPNVFRVIAQKIQKYNWIVGKAHIVEKNGDLILVSYPKKDSKETVDEIFKNNAHFDFAVSQPSHFWAKDLIEKIGLLNERYHYCMDRDWMLRALAGGAHPRPIDLIVAYQRYQPASKTSKMLWAFDIDKARIYRNLGLKGSIKFWPAMHLSCEHASKGYRAYSDVLFSENKKFASLLATIWGWILSRKKIGKGFLSRAIRVFK